MARKNKKAQGFLNNRLGKAALLGGAAWATMRYFQGRSKNKSLNMPVQNQALNNQTNDPSQTGHWSANPKEVEQGGKLPEAQPDNMPGPTETLTNTQYSRY
ncbi:MAG TPA: hypothetical protein VH186_10395 [Chloroflexia bacterium]|nr:hypothetical protein [Chloroflexia bacterium]